MRFPLFAAILSLVCLPAFATSSGDRLVVHEWGTFTSFVGSDGKFLDYRTRIGADLPPFVLDRPRQASVSVPSPLPATAFLKEHVYTYSRMETPVTYFYTDRPMDVNVSVKFPAGLFTEFYPPVVKMAPLVTAAEISGKQFPLVGNGLLDWGKVHLTPATEANVETLPEVSAGDRYIAARSTDSDVVQTADPRTGKTSAEKFLFYRGICNFDMPVAMQSLGYDRFELALRGKTPIAAAYLVEVRNGDVRFTRYADIRGEKSLKLPREKSSFDALADAMVKDLVDASLYEKEARAMVETWKTTWFGEEGTRLLYLLPQSMTDTVLPLHVSPSPAELKRVMVGRLEVMTPEREREIESQLAARSPNINAFGRFAEPVLRRIVRISHNAQAKGRADALLSEIKP